ncbi:MAG: hypothetical protein MJZ86_05025 [Bacteroidales bacterium]|nr:hypothetical protein [Bacteroidales bacterium]
MRYSVDGTSHTISLVGNKMWHEFLDHLFALAEERHTVSFRNGYLRQRNEEIHLLCNQIIFSNKHLAFGVLRGSGCLALGKHTATPTLCT